MKLAEAIPGGFHVRESRADAIRDRAEIAAYIFSHPGCKTFDIELELHFDRKALDRHLRILRESGKIGNGWWAL